MLILNHLLIYSQLLLICLFISLNGFLFKKIILNFNDNKNFEENSLFGFLLIGFIALFINFFYPLSLFLNNIFFLLMVYYAFKLGFFNQNKKDLLKKAIYVSSFSYFLFIYSNVNTPDALLYHLPYSRLINEHKIVIGASNINFSFGHISIFQYISSFFNNSLLGKNGVLLPAAILVSNFLFCCFRLFINDFKKDTSRIKSYFIFLILIISLYSFSRYSGYGNDAQAHIYYFLTIIYLLEYFLLAKTFLNFQKILVLSFFLFLLKPFYIICISIPILIYLIEMRKYMIFKSKFFIFILSFFFLWLLKTFLTTGCIIYPLKFTCFKNVVWFDSKVNIVSTQGEAWAKGWPQNKDKTLNQKDYIKNFNWFEPWSRVHFKLILEKLLPVFSFIVFNFLFFYFTKCLKKNYNYKNISFFILFFLINFLFVIIWFLKIPLFRQGLSFIYTFILFLSYFIFIKNINFKKVKKFYNVFVFCIVLFFVGVVFKNMYRISSDFNQSVSPMIYSNFNINTSNKVFNTDNEFTHYQQANNISCGFSISPCTHFKINVKKKYFLGYLVYIKF